ncbi:MAG: GSU2403 family nucleotidyltransferase fold protein [Parvularculaceae bacterium]
MTIAELPLVIQTSYAELIDQLQLVRATQFPVGTTFRTRTISGRDYWYAQEPTGLRGRPAERYVGPNSPELASAIALAKSAKQDIEGRRAIVRSLKAAGLPEPDGITSAVIDALSLAGVFRLRSLVVGTVAFQTYGGLLGVRLPGAAIRTGDLDIAQDYGVSLAIDDAIQLPLLEILRSVDPQFAPVPSITRREAASSYAMPGGFRVDVLTTNRGRERDGPVTLPSLKSDAAPLRYLDFLLKDSIEAAVLSRSGVLVNTPAPERYAVHKLIVSTLRNRSGASAAKAQKDIAQAGTLIEALIVKRRDEDLSIAFVEARGRGAAWRKRLSAGAARLTDVQREMIRGL